MAVTISCRSGQALNSVREGLLIDLGVLSPDAVAKAPVVDGGKIQLGHDCTPVKNTQ